MTDLNIIDLAREMGLRVVDVSTKVEPTTSSESSESASSVSVTVVTAGPNAVRVCIDSEALAARIAAAAD